MKFVFNPFTNNLDAINPSVSDTAVDFSVQGTASGLPDVVDWPTFQGVGDGGGAFVLFDIVGSSSQPRRNRAFVIVTCKVSSPKVVTDHCVFKYRLYCYDPVNGDSVLNNSEGVYQAYMLPGSENAFNTFTFHYKVQQNVSKGSYVEFQCAEFVSAYRIKLEEMGMTIVSVEDSLWQNY
jgi:hypothetical protein